MAATWTDRIVRNSRRVPRSRYCRRPCRWSGNAWRYGVCRPLPDKCGLHVAPPVASQDRAASDGVDAQVYTFPGVDGLTRIHVLSTTGSADAILLELRGVFAMIDGAEGVGAPDGKDPRYPLRSGTVPGWAGDTDWVLGYMSNHGVTSSDLAFYLGTHAHSDHIDNADEIIRKFRPKVILSPEYSDEWITDKSRLWDNQWVYDNMMAAARWAQGAYGASIVQNVNDYNTHIALGDMDVQIIPTDPAENYKKTGVRDANLIAYTAKVSAFGRSAYLAADLEAGGGYEDRIAPIVGHVDMLKAGHHGLPSSNTESFLGVLSPSVIVQTGPEWYSPDRLTASVVDGTTVWAPMNQLWSSGHIPSLIATFRAVGHLLQRYLRRLVGPRIRWSHPARLVVQGWSTCGHDRLVRRSLGQPLLLQRLCVGRGRPMVRHRRGLLPLRRDRRPHRVQGCQWQGDGSVGRRVDVVNAPVVGRRRAAGRSCRRRGAPASPVLTSSQRRGRGVLSARRGLVRFWCPGAAARPRDRHTRAFGSE